MAQIYNAALPIAYVVLRILIILNWVLGACILGLLIFSFVNEPFLLRALELGSVEENPSLVIGIRAVAALGLASIPLHYAILKRLVAMVETVRAGDPFVADNAYRLQAIAWFLLAVQVLSMIVGGIGRAISTPERPIDLDAGFSVNGWLAVLLTFILARVFAEGTLMREDLEGTV
jgi:hypothetical protein